MKRGHVGHRGNHGHRGQRGHRGNRGQQTVGRVSFSICLFCSMSISTTVFFCDEHHFDNEEDDDNADFDDGGHRAIANSLHFRLARDLSHISTNLKIIIMMAIHI